MLYQMIRHHKLKILLILITFYYKIDFKRLLFYLYSITPKGRLEIKNQKMKAKSIIKNVFKSDFKYNFKRLPSKGMNSKQITKVIDKRKENIGNKISGCVYINDDELNNLLKKVNNSYLFSNPLHPDIYPELIKMESEVVRMIGRLFDMPKTGGGNLTTGGTESTILALKAYKKRFENSSYFYVGKPEVLCCKTVHAAVNKACELLDLKIKYVDLNSNYVMDVNDLYEKITANTCVVIASAPCFPYGLMDPINEIADMMEYYNIPVHVDACLGGFITQFYEHLRLSFNRNIHSISIDPHKYGYAPKGSSLLLWKNSKMRKNQYFIVSDWTGGIYASVSLPGSRVGSQIATTWAALLYNGYDKYKNYSVKISSKTVELANYIRNLSNYIVIGDPKINVVAFYNTKYSIGQLSEYLTKNGWNINILQNPVCLHICITPKNIDNIDELVRLLRNFNNCEPSQKDESITAIYGMAAKIPDKGIVNDLVEYYLDLTTSN